jgi:hypothetical protein
MNVATLQQFLRSLEPALRTTEAGARIAQDLERACTALEPFHGLDLASFAGFLERCDEYRRTGAVSPPSEFDLGPLQQSLRRLGQVRNRLASAGDGAAVKTELLQVQHDLGEALGQLSDSVGLSGKIKGEKWVKLQAEQVRARAHANAFRTIAAQITEPAAFARDDVRAAMERLETDITSDEWKLLAAEFSLPKATKGAKGVGEVLFKLTGQRPASAKTSSQRKAIVVDAAKVERFVGPLRQLLDRAKTEAQLPESEIDQQLNGLEGSLSKEELVEVARQAGVEKPGRSKSEVLNKIKGRLAAGKQVIEQTAH